MNFVRILRRDLKIEESKILTSIFLLHSRFLEPELGDLMPSRGLDCFVRRINTCGRGCLAPEKFRQKLTSMFYYDKQQV